MSEPRLNGINSGTCCYRERLDFTTRNKYIVTNWRNALHRLSFTPRHDSELSQPLSALLEQIVSHLWAEPFVAFTAQHLGAELCTLYGSQPEILSESLRILLEGLLACLPEAQVADFYPRWTALSNEIGLGFNRQMRSQILAEQEELRCSQLQAKQHAQLALQESRQRFRQLMAATSDAVLLHDDGFILETNDVITELLGYPSETLIGASLSDLFVSDDYAFLKNAAANQPTVVTARCLDGSPLVVEATNRGCRYESALVTLLAIHPVDAQQQTSPADFHTHSPQPSSPSDQAQPSIAQTQVDIGTDFQIDLERRLVRYASEVISLSKLEFDLFTYLVAHRNSVCTYDDLLNNVWHYDQEGEPKLVQLSAGRLRKKLSAAGATDVADVVNTVRGVGLCFAWCEIAD